MSESARSKWLIPLVVVPLVVTVVGGIAVYWATVGPPALFGGETAGQQNSTPSGPGTSDPTPQQTTEPARQLSLLERVAGGGWTLQSWNEVGGPVTLGIEARGGTLTISAEGDADWRLDIDERGETHDPQPVIRCGARVTLAGKVEAVPGGERNESIDWTADLRSIDHSSTGENLIRLALCGWATIGTRAHFDITAGGADTELATDVELTNDHGTFFWVRANP